VSDEHLVIQPPPKPEPTELRPHRHTTVMSVVAMLIAVFAALFAGYEACETGKARDAADRAAAAAEKSATHAEELNRLTVDSLKIAQTAASAAERSAKAAETQTLAAIGQLAVGANANELTKESLRARVAVIGVTLRKAVAAGEPLQADVHFENTGGSEAVSLSMNAVLMLASALPPGPMPPLKPPQYQAKGVLAPKAKMSTNLNVPVADMTSERVAALVKSSQKIYAYGVISYETFGRTHQTDFCFVADPTRPTWSEACEKWNATR
jgi:hypothetical protein